MFLIWNFIPSERCWVGDQGYGKGAALRSHRLPTNFSSGKESSQQTKKKKSGEERRGSVLVLGPAK